MIEALENRRLLAAGTLGFGFGLFGTGNERITAQTTDAAGNLYLAGRIEGTVDFNSSPRRTYNLTPDGNSGYFIAKYTADGGLLWAKLVAGATNDNVRVNDLAIDRRTGDLLVGGDFRGGATFAAGLSLASRENSQDGFWGRVSVATGTFTFVTRGISGDEDDQITRIDSDAAGNVYVGGGHGAELLSSDDFGNFLFIEENSANISKFSAKGKFLWVKSWRPQSTDGSIDSVRAMAVTPAGQVFVAGINSKTAPTQIGTQGVGAYLAGFATDGTLIFAGMLKGLSEFPTMDDLAVDSAGNVVAVGSFTGPVDFNISPSKTFTLAGGVKADGFVAKYSGTGKLFYAKPIDGVSEAGGGVAASSVAIDSQGYINVGGSFDGLTYFNPGLSRFRFNSGGDDRDGFVAKFQNNGAFVNAWQLDGPANDEVLFLSAGVGKSAPIFAAGPLRGVLDADPGAGVFNLTGSNGYASFVIKLV